MNKPQFNFGDIVKVNGYYPRLFEIDGRRIERWEYKDEEWADVIYEVYDVLTSDWIECSEEDITLVANADKADAYLAANPPQYEVQAPITPDWMTFMFGGETMSKPKEPSKPTARELSAQLAKERKEARKKRAAEIDNLLDMRNWYADMLEKTNDEAYGDRLFAVDAELKKMTEVDEK